MKNHTQIFALIVIFILSASCDKEKRQRNIRAELDPFKGRVVFDVDYNSSQANIIFEDKSKIRIFPSWHRYNIVLRKEGSRLSDELFISSFSKKKLLRVDFNSQLANFTFEDGSSLKFAASWHRETIDFSTFDSKPAAKKDTKSEKKQNKNE